MERAAIAEEIRSSREDLVDDLAGLRDDQWSAPSLCAGWTVRDVVAHLVRLDHYQCSPDAFGAGVVRSGLRPNRFMAADARAWAADADPAALVTALRRSRHEERWIWRHHPYPVMALGEFVIHGLDIRRPLGLPDTTPVPRLRSTADLVVRDVPRLFRYPLGGWTRPRVRFEATDADWSWGSGPVARGPLASILLVLADRPHGLSDLTGEGTAALAVR